jgi:hypothetical protein
VFNREHQRRADREWIAERLGRLQRELASRRKGRAA